MTSLFHFKEKIHRKHLSKAKTILLLFLRLLSHVLKHLGFSAEPHQEHRLVCKFTFTVEKWQFVPGAFPLPTYPLAKVDPQMNPPTGPDASNSPYSGAPHHNVNSPCL